MPLDRKGWEARPQPRRDRREQALAEGMARLRQVSVPLERLTGSPEWDSYVRIGEQMQETDREALRLITDRLVGLERLSPEDLAMLRHSACVLQAAILARSELLGLPGKILSTVK